MLTVIHENSFIAAQGPNNDPLTGMGIMNFESMFSFWMALTTPGVPTWEKLAWSATWCDADGILEHDSCKRFGFGDEKEFKESTWGMPGTVLKIESLEWRACGIPLSEEGSVSRSIKDNSEAGRDWESAIQVAIERLDAEKEDK